MAESLRNDVKLEDVKIGYGKWEKKVVRGTEITNWFKSHYPGSQADYVKYI